MLEKILGSQTRVQLLATLFERPEEKRYANEILRLASVDQANGSRELIKLTELEFLTQEERGGQKYYSANTASPYYAGFKTLFDAYNAQEARDLWFVLEEAPGIYPLVIVDVTSVKRCNDFFASLKLKSRLTQALDIHEDDSVWFCFIKKEFDALAREIVDRSTQDPDSMIAFNSTVSERADELIAHAQKVRAKNLASLSNSELASLFSAFYATYEKAHIVGWPQNAADFGDSLFTKYLMNCLTDLLTGRTDYKPSEVFVQLTTPTTLSNAQLEHIKLLELLAAIQADKTATKFFATTGSRILDTELPKGYPRLSAMINKHVETFGHLGYGFSGPGWGRIYFIDVLASLIRQKQDAKTLRAHFVDGLTGAEERNRFLLKTLGIDSRHAKIFEVARGFVFTKGYRKDALFYFFSVLENVLREAAKRRYLSLKQMRFVYPHEFENLLVDEKLGAHELNERIRKCVYFSTDDYQTDTILTGEKATAFIKGLRFLQENKEKVTQLNGECASPGKVRGVCKIINTPADMAKMNPGDILVSIATSPELVPAIKKASAIVTNMGGITCHAAIISRELGIPCVIGTKNATKMLKDGTPVDVDASHGKVTILQDET